MVESAGDKGSVTAVSIYKDLSGMPKICVSETEAYINSTVQLETKIKVEKDAEVEEDLDDIDAMLYGNDDKPKRTFC